MDSYDWNYRYRAPFHVIEAAFLLAHHSLLYRLCFSLAAKCRFRVMGLLQILLVTIAGDMIGYPYERHKITSKRTDFPLFERRSRYTDDAALTIAVMEWLLNDENLTWDYLANRFLHYGKKYRT